MSDQSLSQKPESVRIVEVGPRDGLQNEAGTISSESKIEFIHDLVAAGLKTIEATSFVSPKAVPQLADGDVVMRAIRDAHPDITFLALVPNARGYERARSAGCQSIALFAAASDEFSKVNVRATIDETFERFAPVVRDAKADGVSVRGYVSTVTDCPYTGPIPPHQAVDIAERLFGIGCDEVALADTIGHATPDRLAALLEETKRRTGLDRIALHLHDTGGRALDNIMVGLEYGVTTFDASAGGLGGCPFAPGAPGNLGTERLITMLDHLGIHTGIDVSAVAAAARKLPQLST